MFRYNTLKYVFGAICISIVLYSIFTQQKFVWLYVSMALVWLTYITVGAFRMRAAIFLPSICAYPQPSKENLLITFDDGPHPEITPQILHILKQANAKALFFCIGKNIALYPELAKQIVAEGHIVANHSYNHSNFIGMYATDKVTSEILQTEQIIEQCVGKSLKLYRPPFGVTNPNIAKAVKDLNMKVIGWNKRSFDTVSKSKEEVLKRVSHKLKNGDIVLFHDTKALTPVILADFLLFASQKGFTFEVNFPFDS